MLDSREVIGKPEISDLKGLLKTFRHLSIWVFIVKLHVCP